MAVLPGYDIRSLQPYGLPDKEECPISNKAWSTVSSDSLCLFSKGLRFEKRQVWGTNAMKNMDDESKSTYLTCKKCSFQVFECWKVPFRKVNFLTEIGRTGLGHRILFNLHKSGGTFMHGTDCGWSYLESEGLYEEDHHHAAVSAHTVIFPQRGWGISSYPTGNNTFL